MVFELVEWKDANEDKRPDWNVLTDRERDYELRKAYEEKAFRECDKHNWELAIEYGHISIRCLSCLGFYSEINPEYEDDLCYRAPLSSLDYKSDYDHYNGETNDYWLEAE